jgi:dTDP-4-amino-4,6-dideoxygalactose transaminase
MNISLDKVLHSGNLAFGEIAKKFEKHISEFISNDNVLLVNSYQNAFHICLSALGLKQGDEVLLSPLACLQTTQALKSYGMSIKWVDSNIQLGTIDKDSLLKSLSNKSKLVIHNHYCGMVGDIEAIKKICKMNNLLLIDDAIEAFGSKYNNKYIGNSEFSDATIFSFNPVRNPNAIDGGGISFRDNLAFEKSKLLRDYGIDRKLFRLPNGEINPYYDISISGYAATISDVNAYIGITNLKDIHLILNRAKKAARFWEKVLKSNNINHTLFHNPNSEYNYWVFSFKTDYKEKVFNFFRSKGIYCSSVHLPNNNYSVFGEKYIYTNVSKIFDSFIALPTFWWFEDDNFEHLMIDLGKIFQVEF